MLNDFLKNHVLTNLKIDNEQTFGLYFDHTPDHKANIYHKNIKFL